MKINNRTNFAEMKARAKARFWAKVLASVNEAIPDDITPEEHYRIFYRSKMKIEILHSPVTGK